MQAVIAVFDIGKTNKRLLLLNQKYEIVFQDKQFFAETEDDDGYPSENIEAVNQWFRKAFDDANASKEYDIRAVNVSGYGATLVHLDQTGHLATPLYNYLKPYPEELAQQFYSTYGGQEAFSLQTSSPALGMLNTGLHLYWLKHAKPQQFARVTCTLHLPQYFAYLLHGQLYDEITSLGCHTGLWDFEHHRLHRWVQQEGVASLLPTMVASTAYEEIDHGQRSILCGVGMHDSSAALVPYMLGNEDEFLLLSTGTWGITLNPFNNDRLTPEALSQDCLHFLSYQGKPVRASRLLIGREHDHHAPRIAAHFDKQEDDHQTIQPNLDLLNTLLAQPSSEKRFYPQTMRGSGPLPNYSGPETDLSHFDSFEEAYHQLMLNLVQLQAISLRLAQGDTPVRKVFISGGFCRNALYTHLLATYFPEMQFFTSELDEASALGVALVMHEHWNCDHPIDHLFDFKQVEALPLSATPALEVIAP